MTIRLKCIDKIIYAHTTPRSAHLKYAAEGEIFFVGKIMYRHDPVSLVSPLHSLGYVVCFKDLRY